MFHNLFRTTRAAVLGLSAAAWGGTAAAIPVTVAGTTVSFTFDSALSGLFGTPGVVGDTLFFVPTTFKAAASHGSFAMASQTFNVAVLANPGYRVSTVNLGEDGDYYNMGTGAAVAVGGKFYLRDLETPLAAAVSSSITASAPLTAVTTMAGFTTTNWTAAASVSAPASAWGGADGVVNHVNVTVENLLLADTDLSSKAFIEKKFASIAVITTPIPEPQAYLMFLAGLGLVGWVAGRRTGKA